MYSRGAVSALGFVCSELGAETLRSLHAYPMRLDAAQVASLVDMEMRVRSLDLASTAENSERMLGSVRSALKRRHSEMLSALPLSAVPALGEDRPRSNSVDTAGTHPPGAKSSLGDAKISLGDAKSLLGDAG